MKLDPSVAILVLGQALEKNGSLPRSLIGRLYIGLSLVKQFGENYDNCLLVLSGGDVSAVGITEATGMQKFVDLNYPEKVRTLKEEQSRNTVENAINCLHLVNKVHNINRIHLVTSEFHIPRTKCIFESVLKSTNELDACLEIAYHSADSGHPTGHYRKLAERPSNVNDWRLCERLDWECNAIQSLNEYLAKYSLRPLSESRLQLAIEELRQMNETSKR